MVVFQFYKRLKDLELLAPNWYQNKLLALTFFKSWGSNLCYRAGSLLNLAAYQTRKQGKACPITQGEENPVVFPDTVFSLDKGPRKPTTHIANRDLLDK